MMFLNTYEIDEARARYASHPVLGPAAQTLANLRDAADANSDGWAYWPKPARAAALLQKILTNARTHTFRSWDPDYVEPTAADVRRAYAPIKAFRTRSGIAFDIVDVYDDDVLEQTPGF
jgi:hypothetical protein